MVRGKICAALGQLICFLPSCSSSNTVCSRTISRWVILDGLKFPGVDKEVEALRQRLALPILTNPPPLGQQQPSAPPSPSGSSASLPTASAQHSHASLSLHSSSSNPAMQVISQLPLHNSSGSSATADRTTNRTSIPSIRMPSPSPSPPSSASSTPRGSSLNAPLPSGAYQRGQSMRENASPPVVFPENRQKGSSLGRRIRTPEEIANTDALLKAARAGDLDTIKKLIFQQGLNPNVRNDEGQTSVYVAVLSKQIEVIMTLLVHPDLEPNVKDIVGHTPLHVAAKMGRPRKSDLEEKAAPPQSQKEQEEEDKVCQMIRLLLSDKRTDPNAKDFSFHSPLGLSVAIGVPRIVRALVEGGAVVNTSTVTQVTPLHTACQMGFTEIVQFLLTEGAMVNCKDYGGYTPLHLAAQGNYADIVKLLRAAGADVHAQLKENKKAPVDLTTSDYIRNYLLDLKTSYSHPFQIDWPKSPATDASNPVAVISRIGMSMCPGRSKGEHRRNLDMDIEVLKKNGVSVLVSLVRQEELNSMGIPTMFQKVKDAGIESLHHPITDKWLPASMEDLIKLCKEILQRLRDGKKVLVHCNGGKGRTGLVVVSCCVMLGMDPSEATDNIRAARPGMLYNPAQILYVRALKAYLTGQIW